MEQMAFADFKKKALELGFTTIRRDGAGAVALQTWCGVSPYAAGGPGGINIVNTRYFLEGNRLRVHVDLNGDVWYTLD